MTLFERLEHARVTSLSEGIAPVLSYDLLCEAIAALSPTVDASPAIPSGMVAITDDSPAYNGVPCWLWHRLWKCGPQIGYYDDASKWWRIVIDGALTPGGDIDKDKWWGEALFPSHWSSTGHPPAHHKVPGWSPCLCRAEAIAECIDVLRGNLLAGSGSEGREQRDADIAILEDALRVFGIRLSDYQAKAVVRAMLAFSETERAAPEGWVMVPREPTEAILEVGGLAILDGAGDPDVLVALVEDARRCWTAMLSAIPPITGRVE